MRVFTLFDSCSPTDGPTDRRTDGRTDKASYRVACPQLKKKKKEEKKCNLNSHWILYCSNFICFFFFGEVIHSNHE